MLFVVLLVFGFSFSPAHAASGLEYLSAQQNADGGIGNTATSLATPVQATAETLRAYQVLGQQNLPAYTPALGYLNGDPEANSEFIARKIVVNAQAGNNAAALISELLTRQNPDGGFGDQTGYDSSAFDTAFALEALAVAHYNSGQTVAFAVGYLLNHQNANGGWAVGDNDPSVFVTVQAMRALTPYRNTYQGISGAIQSAQNYLLSQRVNGLWAEPHDTALALIALLPIADRSVLTGSIAGLNALQQTNGSWVDDPYTTALALHALALAATPEPDPDLGILKGRVVDAATGTALSNVTIVLSDTASVSATSGVDGVFQFNNLEPGTYSISISLAGYISVSTQTTVSANAIKDLGTISLIKNATATTGTMHGVVTDALTNLPISGAAVTVTGALPTVTDASGIYQISNVPAGAVTLTASKAGYATATGTATMTAGTVLVFSPALSAQTGTVTIQGRIIDSATTLPLSDVTVTLAGPVQQTFTTSADGSFSFVAVPAGSYTLEASSTGFFGTTATLSASPGSLNIGDLALSREAPGGTGTVRGTVTDAQTGQPLAGASISVGGNTATTDASGMYVVANLTPGDVVVQAARSGYVSVAGSGQLVAGGVLVFSPALIPVAAQETALEGTATDAATNAPLAGVTISVTGVSSASASTDAQGRYRIANLAPGAILVTASLSGYDTVSASGTVVAGGTTTFSPRLYANNTTPPDANATGVTGVVLDAGTNQPLAGVNVTASYQSTGWSTHTDASGVFTLTGLPGASIILSASTPGYLGATLSFTLEPLQVLDVGQIRLRNPDHTLLPDLIVTAVDNAQVISDPQTLSATGTVVATVQNRGTIASPDGVHAIAFQDFNGNRLHDPAEMVLGETVIPSLAIEQSQTVTISVSGNLTFRDAPVSVFVDSDEVVIESVETNNVGISILECAARLDPDLPIFGLKSCGSDPLCPGSNSASLPPTHLFSFREDGSSFMDVGAVTLQGNNIDVDALALSHRYGLLAFELRKSGSTTIGSLLVSINRNTAQATVIGQILGGRDIRGAVFDQLDNLWVLDVASDEVLQINPDSGATIGTPVGVTLNGIPFDISDSSDIAVNQDGVFYLVNLEKIFTLDISSGALTLVHADQIVEGTSGNTSFGPALAGAVFSATPSQNALVVYEINALEDIRRYDLADNFARTILYPDIIPRDTGFNAGRGDLASALNIASLDLTASLLRVIDRGAGQGMGMSLRVGNVSSAPGPVSWWPGEENIDDIADSNPGIWEGTAAYAPGKIGQAFRFNGSSRVRVPNAPNLRVTQDEFTVEAWVKFDALSGGVGTVPGDMSIMDTIVGGVNAGGWRLLKQTDNRFWFCFGAVTNRCYDPEYTVFSTTHAQVGTYYHVVAVKTATQFALYVNGNREDVRTLPSFISDNQTSDLLIGANAVEGAHFIGLIDDAKIYNRALSSAEILAAFSGNGTPGSTAEVAFYDGDPAAGGTPLGSTTAINIPVNGFRDVVFNTTVLPSGTRDIYSIVDFNDRVAECREDNNSVHTPLATSLVGDIAVSTDKRIYGPESSVLLHATVANKGHLTTGFTAQLFVEDSQGTLVKSFPPHAVNGLASLGIADIADQWNSGLSFAGSYRLRGQLRDVFGGIVGESVSLFEIQACGETTVNMLVTPATIPGNNPANRTPVLRFTFEGTGELTPLSSIPSHPETLINDPSHATFSPWNELFVANRHGNVAGVLASIARFTFDEDGNFIANGAITGNSLEAVHGVAFSPGGELFAANLLRGTISRFKFDVNRNAIPNGTFYSGTPNSQGLAFSSNGELFITDSGNNNARYVQRWRFDPVTGSPIHNGTITIPGALSPHGLAFDSKGELFIGDLATDLIYRFVFDSAGNAISNGAISASDPVGIAFSPSGEMFVPGHASGGISRFLFDQNGNAIPNGVIPTPTLGGIAIKPILVKPDDSCVPAVKTEVTTDKPVYDAWDTVTFSSRIQNTAPNVILAPTRIELTARSPIGTVLLTEIRSAGELVPSALRDLTFSMVLVDAAAGSHSVEMVLKDQATGEVLSTSATSFQVQRREIQALTGEVTVSAPQVYQGDGGVCTETAKNISGVAQSGVRLMHQLIHVDTGTVVSEVVETVDLAPGGVVHSYFRNIDTAGFALGGYTCVIKAELNGDTKTLAFGGFQVVPPPIRIDADLALGAKGRLLVLLDNGRHGEDDNDGHGDDDHDGHDGHGDGKSNKRHCDGVKQLSLSATFGSPLSDAATVTASVSGRHGAFVDSELANLAGFPGALNLSAGGNSADLVLSGLTAHGIELTLQPVGGAMKLGEEYSVEVIAQDGNTVRLVSGKIRTDCHKPLYQGQTLGDFTLDSIETLAAANDAHYRDTDPHGPATAPGLKAQRLFLESLLKAEGWSYTITDTAGDFTREFRTGGYTAYAIFAEQEKLKEQVQKELREAVFRGDGLLVAGIHDSRNQKFHDALGIKLIGSVKTGGVDLAASNLGVTGRVDLISGDKALRIKRLHADTLGIYSVASPSMHSGEDDCKDDKSASKSSSKNGESDDHDDEDDGKKKNNKEDYDECEGHPERHLDAVTLNAYGKGRSVFTGFDLLATATRDGLDSLGAILLAKSLEQVHPDEFFHTPGAVVPLTLTLANHGIATSATATIGLPAGTAVVDPGIGTVSANTMLFNLNLAVSEEKRLTFWVKLPQSSGPVTFEAVVTAPNLAQPVATDSYTVTVLQPDSLTSINADLAGLISSGSPHASALRRAERHVTKGLQNFFPQMAIPDLLRATDALLGIEDPAVETIRYSLDVWIRWAAQYY